MSAQTTSFGRRATQLRRQLGIEDGEPGVMFERRPKIEPWVVEVIRARVGVGWTQKQAAERLKLSPGTVSQIVNRKGRWASE